MYNIFGIVSQAIGYFALSKEGKIDAKKIKAQSVAKKQERDDELESARHAAKIKKMARDDKTESDYDLMALENARTSIMDEVMITYILVIVAMIFIPSTQQTVIDGFKALTEHTPVWFSTIFVGAFISKLGLRFMFGKGNILKK
jgi:hypothetical protein